MYVRRFMPDDEFSQMRDVRESSVSGTFLKTGSGDEINWHNLVQKMHGQSQLDVTQGHSVPHLFAELLN